MKFDVLASGSKGNCTYIEINNHKFLIDIGINFLSLSQKLKEINVNINEIEGIFITHSHVDHIAGLKTTLKYISPKIFLTDKILNEIKFDINHYVSFLNDINFINDIKISIIKLSHDVSECIGYIFEYNNKKLVYITDTGYINEKYFDQIENSDIYIIESNHDVNLLMSTSRPYFLKARILGDYGHISNKDCSYYLSKIMGNNTKYIILAHLSEEANDPLIALESINKISNDKINIIVANQYKSIGEIEI